MTIVIVKIFSIPTNYFIDFDKTLRPQGVFDRPSEIGGLALEGLVTQHLNAWCSYSADDTKLFYWRTKSGVEIDFVVYGNNTLVAFEVKYSSNVREECLFQ
ncbi:MAG: DUF4143 domain-containing protein [Puniceicoccales bacterium]|jgi:predicted AAA+ superfamily ATPase|nr:DUF4143 domain-containing protein [Puniceicoccales bacterium]